MNILILTHSYPDTNYRWRGIFIKEQAKALSIKHNVTVVYFKIDYSRFAPFSRYSFFKKQNGKITEYEVTINKSFPVINQLKYLLDTYRFINDKILTGEKIDIIHSHLSYPAGFLGTLIQKRKRIPNIITEHSWIKKHFRSWIHKRCVFYALRNSCQIVSVSKALKDDIESYIKREVSIIPNVIEVDKFSASKNKKSDTLHIGILGGMNNYNKGQDILLKSVNLLRTKNILIHIGGDGIYLHQFKTMAKDLGVEKNCKFYGEVLPADINKFYSGLDIFILASRFETFGVVLVEAMACGIPVIATKCGGPEEIVTENTGMLVDKENPEKLAQAIDLMSDNLESYDRDTIRKYAQEKYGQENFVNNMTQIYSNLLSCKTSTK